MQSAELELLLSQDAWLRRLAARLLADESASEDLVQEAWVAVLGGSGRGPSGLRSPRAWLAAVVKNLSRESLRRQGRREERERAAARPEALPGTDELVEQLSLRKRVAECLLELEEPLRTALYLRFFQDLALKEVAGRQGVPLSTAYARIRRGLELLRARLDREHGGERTTWAVGLLELVESPRPSAERWIAGLTAGTGVKVAASLLVLAGACAWITRATESREPRVESAAAALLAEEQHPENGSALQEPSRAPQREALLPVNAATGEAGTESAHAALRGRVLGPGREPLGGIEIELVDGLLWKALDVPVQRSTADGRFEFPELPSGPARVEPVARDASRAALQRAEQDGEWLLLMSGTGSFAGRVEDEAGTPIARAGLIVAVRDSFYRELGVQPPVEYHDQGWKTETDAAGRFVLSGFQPASQDRRPWS